MDFHWKVSDVYGLIASRSNICSLCLKEGALKPLSEEHSIQYLADLSFFDILLDYEMPKEICENCLKEFQRIFVFIAKCRQAQEILNQIEQKCSEIPSEPNLHIDFVDAEEAVVEVSPNDIIIPEVANDWVTEVNHVPQIIEEVVNDWVKEVDDVPQQETSKEAEKKICVKCGEAVLALRPHYKVSKACRPRNYKCSQCGKAFSSRGRVREHAPVHRDDPKTFMCHVCSKLFKYRINLKRHLNNHELPKRFMCEMCGKAYTTKIQLDDHLNIHTGKKPFKCKYCDKTFACRSQKSLHEKRHKNGTREVTERKQRDGSNETNGEPKLRLEYGPVTCTVCERELVHERALKLHMRCHNEVDVYKCKICPEEFKSSMLLYHHSKTHVEADIHQCPHCPRRFKSPAYLTVHIRTHTGEKPFACPECPKKFVQRAHLTYHMMIHKGKKSFRCQYCNKAFFLKGNLTVHMRLHTGERPYLCHVCKKGFCDSSSRKRHVRSYHGENEVGNIHNNFSVKEDQDEDVKVEFEHEYLFDDSNIVELVI